MFKVKLILEVVIDDPDPKDGIVYDGMIIGSSLSEQTYEKTIELPYCPQVGINLLHINHPCAESDCVKVMKVHGDKEGFVADVGSTQGYEYHMDKLFTRLKLSGWKPSDCKKSESKVFNNTIDFNVIKPFYDWCLTNEVTMGIKYYECAREWSFSYSGAGFEDFSYEVSCDLETSMGLLMEKITECVSHVG